MFFMSFFGGLEFDAMWEVAGAGPIAPILQPLDLAIWVTSVRTRRKDRFSIAFKREGRLCDRRAEHHHLPVGRTGQKHRRLEVSSRHARKKSTVGSLSHHSDRQIGNVD
jgi:hypothetical protein